eukprot:TRINITY_DN4695_c0_g2_i1.p1 TRINITY_DN4695_c0_g2~~TRINITY_DN4695_c0_g2_i1.p1  ORF type:complete len:115 (+),score=9.98 TRINITY_DN4695_c0_g2_i1:46-345(+)
MFCDVWGHEHIQSQGLSYSGMAPPMAALHCTWALSCLMVEIASRALLLPHLDTCETRVTAEGACMTGRLKAPGRKTRSSRIQSAAAAVVKKGASHRRAG